MAAKPPTSPPDQSVPAALTQAATMAGYAPSVSNTQPWRWRVRPDRLDLFADRSRQLLITDPDARLLMISCGAALHHARIALAVAGWAAKVDHLPNPAEPDLLASLLVTGPTTANIETTRMAQAMSTRHTDRRPVSDQRVPGTTVTQIEAAVTGLARLQILTADQVLQLAAIAARAAAVQAENPQIRDELEYWTTRAGGTGTGIPSEAIPAQPPQTTVPGRDFGRPGTLPIGVGHDRAAVYALLFGDEDEPDGWLRGGEALSAAWLTATALDVSVVPLSAVVEVLSTRQALRQILAGIGYPYLVLRLGLADPAQNGPPHTPRMPAAQMVDTSPVDPTELPATDCE